MPELIAVNNNIEKLIELSKKYKIIITIEEGSRGGFGSLVAEFIANLDLLSTLNQACKIFQLHMPDQFVLHNTIENQRQKAGISTDKIVKFVCDL